MVSRWHLLEVILCLMRSVIRVRSAYLRMLLLRLQRRAVERIGIIIALMRIVQICVGVVFAFVLLIHGF